MDFLYMLFPVSGVRTYAFLPPLVAFVLSFFTSMGGISGAFLLLPFQMSYLNFTSPAVSSTNFLYNVVAIPSGVCRFIREGRMTWPLTAVLIAGTLPGVFIGYYVRVAFLPDPRTFKLFVGCVLLYIAIRLLYDIIGRKAVSGPGGKKIDEKFRGQTGRTKGPRRTAIKTDIHSLIARCSSLIAQPRAGLPPGAFVNTVSFSLRKVEYEFRGETFSFSTPSMFSIAFVVGIIGGAYGIGGGAIIAPVCVAIFNLPVYTVAGAALLSTFMTSVAGIVFYTTVPLKSGVATSPDWLLGAMFGVGGFAGMYLGARFQKHMPQKIIK
ncbi:MAG: sulfite exporter TauE/SafE family protein, partial [Candidatus Sulfobium sp.]